MSTRIYKVKTPTGDRLVEASTKSQAINHCVSTDYQADPISSSDLYAAMQSGAQVEKVMPQAAPKKSDSPELSTSLAQPALSPQAPSVTPSQPAQDSTPAPASMSPQPTSTPPAQPASQGVVATAPTVAAAPAADVPPPAFLRTAAAPFVPPQPAGVNPVIAEQQRINPQAAIAAGVPPVAQSAPAPIIARPAAPAEEKQWEDREPQ